MSAPVLVVAATGRVAGALTDALRQDGVPVRALVRNREKAVERFPAGVGEEPNLEIIDGAFDDPAVQEAAFDGVEAAFLGLGTSPKQEELETGLIDAAAKHRTPHLVRLSVFGADPASTFEVARRHGAIDRHIEQLGLPHTLLRPTYFSSNLLLAAATIATVGTWSTAVSTGRIAIIDARDVGLAARTVLTDQSRRDHSYDLTGPQSLTLTDVAKMFTTILGRRVEHRTVSIAERHNGLTDRGAPDWLASIAVGIDVAMQSGAHDVVTADLRRLIDHEPRTVADFIGDHRAAFERH